LEPIEFQSQFVRPPQPEESAGSIFSAPARAVRAPYPRLLTFGECLLDHELTGLAVIAFDKTPS
jgi:hypothetical protein